jgi:hypothetical protein
MIVGGEFAKTVIAAFVNVMEQGFMPMGGGKVSAIFLNSLRGLGLVYGCSSQAGWLLFAQLAAISGRPEKTSKEKCFYRHKKNLNPMIFYWFAVLILVSICRQDSMMCLKSGGF